MTEAKRTTKPPRGLFATRGMTRFQCIAEKCEDTCCQAFVVALTAPELERMRRALAVDEAGKKLFRESITREASDQEHPGVMAKKKGRCSMLDEHSLCQILTRGNAYTAMPNTCITFPRRFGTVANKGVEVYGSCACAEAARLTLLPEDGLDLVPAPPEVSGLYPDAKIDFTPMPYDVPLEHVRTWGMERLLDPELPLAARLLTFIELGKQVDGFFHRETWAEEPARLEAALQLAASPATGQRLKAAAQAVETAALGAVLGAVWSVLRTKLGGPSGRLDRLLPPALERWGGEDAGAEVLAQGYAAAARALPPRAELLLARYCASDWQRDWYSSATTVTERGMSLLSRACAARLTIASQPALGDPATDAAAVDAALIEAIQVAAKHFEHDPGAVPAMLDALRREVEDPAEQALAMAMFCA